MLVLALHNRWERAPAGLFLFPGREALSGFEFRLTGGDVVTRCVLRCRQCWRRIAVEVIVGFLLPHLPARSVRGWAGLPRCPRSREWGTRAWAPCRCGL